MRNVSTFGLALYAAGCSVTVQHPIDAAHPGEIPVLQVETGTYVLYAASQERALGAAADLDLAAGRAAELLGLEAPPRIGVVVFEHPDHVQGYDFSSKRDQGLLVLPWLSDEALFEALQRAAGPLASRSSLPVRTIAHEACHLFLIAHVSGFLGHEDPNERLRTQEQSTYGDPDLPDWVDEAFAVLCEPEEMLADRRENMRQNIDHHIPLAQFVVMEHPSQHSAREDRAPAEEAAARRPGARITIRRVDRSTPNMFYPQALSLAEFLLEHAGSDIIAKLVEGFAQGWSFQEMLSGVTGTPTDLAELEAQWLAWVAR